MSLLLTNNSTATAVAASGIVPLGVAVHGCGKDIRLAGNSIALYGNGYYNIDADLSVAVTGTGAITAQLYADGMPIAGAFATATPAAAGATVNLSIPWIFKKKCDCSGTVITIVLSAAGSVSNATVKVTK